MSDKVVETTNDTVTEKTQKEDRVFQGLWLLFFGLSILVSPYIKALDYEIQGHILSLIKCGFVSLSMAGLFYVIFSMILSILK